MLGPAARAALLLLLAVGPAVGCGPGAPAPPAADPLLVLGDPQDETAAGLFFDVVVADGTGAYGGPVTVTLEGPLGQPQSRRFELEVPGPPAPASQATTGGAAARPGLEDVVCARVRPGSYVLVGLQVAATRAPRGGSDPAAPLPALRATVERRFTIPPAKLVYLGALRLDVAARGGGHVATVGVVVDRGRSLAATLLFQRRHGSFVEALLRRSPDVLVPGLAPPLTLDTAGIPCEPRQAAACTSRCDRGDARSCRDLGRLFDEGQGVRKDPVQAAAAFARACELGLGLGCTEVGWMHEAGLGTPKNPARAASLYRQACVLGDAHGCTNLGWLYDSAEGVALDQARAADLYRRGCAGGSYRACNNLGWLFQRGHGVPRDEARAADLFRRSCAGGHANGCSAHGWAVALGRGTTKDRPAGLAGLRAGCAGGSSLGCQKLRAFCEEGDGLACHLLAELHAGGTGVPRDAARAADLTRQACGKGHAPACAGGAAPAGAPAAASRPSP